MTPLLLRTGLAPIGSDSRILNVVHVLPQDDIGGVELAARSLPAGPYPPVVVHKLYIASRPSAGKNPYHHQGPRTSESNPLNYLWALRRLLRLDPDLLVASLWRSCLVLLAMKLMRPRVGAVVFLHSAKSVHLLDRVTTALAMRLALEVWADSETTLASRVPHGFHGRCRIVSFMTEPVSCDARSAADTGAPTCRFVFWGRLHRHKGLDRAVALFARLLQRLPTSTYTIIGPDGGERARLEALCCDLGIAQAVRFLGPLSQAEIRAEAASHCFYLQTSILEGMAMAVVEAMQLGLVPVVTPVGEIGRYCRDGENAVLVTADDDAIVSRIEHLLAHPAEYARLSAAAVAQWQSTPLYRDDFLAACAEILGRPCVA
jgi:glycosyltransferase involved in cell wall biosynthesis